MKLVADCVLRMVPEHWVTEVESNESHCSVLAYPTANSRYTLVVGAWLALLDDGQEVELEGYSSYADLMQSLDSDVAADDSAADNEQHSLEF